MQDNEMRTPTDLDPGTSTNLPIKWPISLTKRVLLAVASGLTCAVLFTWEPDLPEFMAWSYFYVLPGLIFTAAVLLPSIQTRRFYFARLLAIGTASVFGYWVAVWISLAGFLEGSQWQNYTAGSVASVAVVMITLAIVAPLRVSSLYALTGVIAAVLGGLIAGSTLSSQDLLPSVVGFVFWQTAVCLAIYFGSPTLHSGASSAMTDATEVNVESPD